MVTRDETTEEVPEPEAAFEHARTQAERDPRGALRTLFSLFRGEPLHREGLALAADLSDRLGSQEEAALFRAVAAAPLDPQGLYDLGFQFVEGGMPEVGVAYLERCHRRLPDHVLVAYELGYALFAAGRYRDAAPLLEQTANSDALAGPEPFFARALLVEALVYSGDLAGASHAFDGLDVAGADRDGEAQVDALAQLLARAQRFAQRTRFGPRDRHFVVNGGVVLHVSRDAGEAHVAATAGTDFVAGLLRRMESLLGALDLVPTRVLWHGDEMLPLAGAFARRTGARLARLGDEPADARAQTLVFVKDPARAGEVLPLLRERDENVDLFMLSLDARQDHPLMPEIVGLFAASLALPWEQRLEFVASAQEGAGLRRVDADTRSSDALAAELADAAGRIDDDAGDKKALGRYYVPLKDLLLLGNYAKFPARRVFVARRDPA